jgi:L-histidine N-alpha-methyltransferase
MCIVVICRGVNRNMDTKIMNQLSKPVFNQQFAEDTKLSLSGKPKYLKPKYFYDYTGSELFEEICRQPEYYLTRTEASILETYSSTIAEMQGNDSIAIIELESGSSLKTRILIQAFLGPKQKSIYYYPIDISYSILQNTVKILSNELLNLQIAGLPADFLDGIDKANQLILHKNIYAEKIIVFLGSSIGNFVPKEAESFLKVLADKLNEDDSVLIGFDLHKDEKILNAAYNDSAGITAKFNLNILHRMNKELGGEFDSNLFKHRAFYNKDNRQIEVHLVSTCKQHVYIKEIHKTIDFEQGETIHTENSYKYTLKQIDALAKRCNLKVRKHFTDPNHWFDLAVFNGVNQTT